ncbi:MAG: hypothetical protein IPL93_14610 [Actinomycetales bacterium]|nr:hypothetical protein [Actinomycetales bacterium]
MTTLVDLSAMAAAIDDDTAGVITPARNYPTAPRPDHRARCAALDRGRLAR